MCAIGALLAPTDGVRGLCGVVERCGGGDYHPLPAQTDQESRTAMKIHEYQGKQLFAAAGVPVPKGIVAKTPDEAAAAFKEVGTAVAVVKSQIHAGGRGKGRFKEHPQQPGVVLVKS